MTAARPYLAENRAELMRLRAVSQRLNAGAMEHDRGSGWTAAATLAHLAIWDRIVATCLTTWQRRPQEELAGRVTDRAGWINDETIAPLRRAGISVEEAASLTAEQINDRITPIWTATSRAEAADDAVAAAAELERIVASLPEPMISLIEGSRFAWMLTPFEHQREHIAEIEAGLGNRKAPR